MSNVGLGCPTPTLRVTQLPDGASQVPLGSLLNMKTPGPHFQKFWFIMSWDAAEGEEGRSPAYQVILVQLSWVSGVENCYSRTCWQPGPCSWFCAVTVEKHNEYEIIPKSFVDSSSVLSEKYRSRSQILSHSLQYSVPVPKIQQFCGRK